jgi:hypothetical protein
MDAKRKDEPQTSCGFMQIKEGRWWKGGKVKNERCLGKPKGTF